MLDIRLIRENPEAVKKNLARRKSSDVDLLLAETIKADGRWRAVKQELDNLRKEHNRLTEKVKELKAKGKGASAVLEEAKRIPAKKASLEAEERELKASLESGLMRLPNILEDDVPLGADDSENLELRKWGKPKNAAIPKPHGDLLQAAGLANFEDAARVSGAGFYFLEGELARLDLALQQFALDFLQEKGFRLILPPLMLRKEAYAGTTDMGDFETVMYKIDGEPVYLIATSEHAICAMHSNKIFSKSDLPLKYAGASPCFRREIGAHGVDSRGLFRVHQFNKVEQFVFCKPEQSRKFFDELLANAESLYQKLEIPYRAVAVCTGDIGTVAAKKIDLEAWMPREQKYREAVSCSNCASYQAIRSGIKFRENDSKEFVHTINSTAIATTRTIRALIENNFKGDSFTLPKALHKYMGGIKEISLKP